MATKQRAEKRNRYGIAEARAHLGEIVDRVRFTGEPIILEKSGNDAVILIPAPRQRYAQTDKSKTKDALERVREAVKLSGLSDSEIEELVSEAIAWARDQRMSESR